MLIIHQQSWTVNIIHDLLHRHPWFKVNYGPNKTQSSLMSFSVWILKRISTEHIFCKDTVCNMLGTLLWYFVTNLVYNSCQFHYSLWLYIFFSYEMTWSSHFCLWWYNETTLFPGWTSYTAKCHLSLHQFYIFLPSHIGHIRGLSKKKPNFLFKTFIDKLTT
jgi:hypothetical protein